ncbi:MAG: hypothetical protein KAJ51_13640, partial [Thermoplasmata archaeon]|nr:hypothetical protein [Thermoplasmata archaeon]
MIRKKVTLIIILFLLLLNIFQATMNTRFIAANSDNNSKNILIKMENKLVGDEDHDYGQIKILSEPIFSQNFNTGGSQGPKIAMEGEKRYVVWEDSNNTKGAGTDYDILYRYFNGSIWSEVQVISEPIVGNNINTGNSRYSDIAVDNGKIYVVWSDWNNTNGAGTDWDIFYRCNLTGSGWEDIKVISEPIPGFNMNDQHDNNPNIVAENGKVYVVWWGWNDTNNAGNDDDIFYRCNLNGVDWEDTQVISEPIFGYNFNTANSFRPAIAVENGKVYVVWEDFNNSVGSGTDRDILFRANLIGNYWEDIQVISEPVPGDNRNIELSESPAIAVENGKIYVAWGDENDTNGAGDTEPDIFYRCNIIGTSWERIQVISEPIPGNDINTRLSMKPDLVVENSRIYLTWTDLNNTNGAGTDYDIFLRYNITNSNWGPTHVISEPRKGSDINIGESAVSKIAVYLSKCHVVWQDTNNTNGAGIDHDVIYWNASIPPALSIPRVTPISGNTSTNFNFTVIYLQVDNEPPIELKISISSTNYSMLQTDPTDLDYSDGKHYFYNTKLNISNSHTFQCWASDTNYTVNTAIYSGPIVLNTPPQIITEDNLTAIEDIYYEIRYDYTDIDIDNIGQVGSWNFSTNASWLNFNQTTATLYGTPTNEDV